MILIDVDIDKPSQPPEFIQPYNRSQMRTVDLVTDDKHTVSFEYLANDGESNNDEFALSVIGNWLCYFNPNVAKPSEGVMHKIKYVPNRNSESTVGYFIYTATTLLAQQQIKEDIKDSVVVDFGSGDGIQALASLKLGAKHVILFEQNTEALKKAEELMALNGFGKDKYTIIADDLDNGERYQDILKNADIGIANIGNWGKYQKAHLKAAELTKYSPKMKYYLAGGYSHEKYGDNNIDSWKDNDETKGEADVKKLLSDQGFTTTKTVDGHSRGLLNYARTIITKKI